MAADRPPPHPPGETAAELLDALALQHPELSRAQIEALLTGEPARRHGRPRTHAAQGWTAGARARGNGQGVKRRGRRKR